MFLSRSSVLFLGLTPALIGCGGGWRRLNDLTPRILPARTQVQVWQGEHAILLHGVTLDADTVRGVPFTEPPECDSCRVQLALGAVDSLRAGSRERGFVRTVGLVALIGGAWAYLARGIGGD